MAHSLSYSDCHFFSPLIQDYSRKDEKLSTLIHRFPSIENFGAQIREKRLNFPATHRQILVETLRHQYRNIKDKEIVIKQLSLLENDNSFTVTTGHQLSLFTGPLYFIYKIVSTIKLCEKLKSKYPENQFIPIYWLASEDHDFEEIRHFRFQKKKFSWESHQTGAVGRFSTESLQSLSKLLQQELGSGKNATHLHRLFEEAYLKHDTLSEATRFLVHQLFGQYGLVCIDADEKSLKTLFIPHLLSEIQQQNASRCVSESSALIKKIRPEYTVQVHPRPINLFYLSHQQRERLVKTNTHFEVLHSDFKFSREQLVAEIQKYPERFSPNVILRPLYQEVILPNLCYIGGGGEIAYWLELKSLFNEEKVPFPILLVRNSAILISQQQQRKLQKLQLNDCDLLQKKSELLLQKIHDLSAIPIDFSPQKEYLRHQFKALYNIASQTDYSFFNAVKAQEAKQTKGLDQLEKRLLKAQKKKLSQHLSRLELLYEELFPLGNLQERVCNFSEFYIENPQLISVLMEKFDPLSQEFSIITY